MSAHALTTAAIWSTFAELGQGIFASAVGGEVHRGPGWFALLSGEASCELNVCGLTPSASPESAAALVAVVERRDLPAIVSVSAANRPEVTAVLATAGFERGPLQEPLMWCDVCPSATVSPFRVARADDEDAIDAGLDLSAEAHGVAREMLGRTIGRAVRAGSGLEAWLAWDDQEPVSVVFLSVGGPRIGVWSMMTPARHRRRGAGRAVLTGALAARWAPGTEGAFLWSSPAGRALYTASGFTVADDAAGWARGADEDLLAAIGHFG